MPAIEYRTSINRKRAPHPDQGGDRAVALQEKLDTRRFGAPGASHLGSTRVVICHERLSLCTTRRGIANVRSHAKIRHGRSHFQFVIMHPRRLGRMLIREASVAAAEKRRVLNLNQYAQTNEGVAFSQLFMIDQRRLL